MACNFNWFIKITRSFGSGFQIQNCKARSKIDHDWCRSKQTFLPDPIREHFWLWIADSTFHYLLFFFPIVNIMFILIMSVALMAWPSQNPDTVSTISYSYSLRRGNIYCCMLSFWGYADPWFFSHFSASSGCNFYVDWAENSIVTLRLVSCHRCAMPRFDLLFGVLKGISQVSCIVVSNQWWL